MDNILYLVLLLALSYLIGSIPSGVIVSKLFFGFDIRDKGSGNMGSTNVFRVLGKKWGVIVQLADIAKGVIPVLLAMYLVGEEQILWQLLAGISSVIGHIFPIFSKFKGGKGINTLAGMLLTIAPIDTGVALLIFLAAFLSTGIVSLGSILAAIGISVSLIVRELVLSLRVEGFYVLLPFFILISFLVILTHRKNIQRLMKGEENRFKLPWLNKDL